LKLLNKTNGKFDEISKQVLLDLPDGKYQVEKRKIKRSNDQNKYWWGVVVKLIADWLRSFGNDVTDNDVHEFLKMKYIGKREVTINGKTFERYKGTSELTTIEFADMIAKVQRDFAEKDLIIPDPGQTIFI
jgi:hypothetical protein